MRNVANSEEPFRGGAGTPLASHPDPPGHRYSNLDLKSQEAYEMAVQGVIRPMDKSPMLISGIRCLHFAPPEFLLGKSLRKLEWCDGAWIWSQVWHAEASIHWPGWLAMGGFCPPDPSSV